MSSYTKLLQFLPEVKSPLRKNLPFKEKLKWTFFVLLTFFVLSTVPLFGLGDGGALQNFEFLSLVLGASFGSIVTLGIGPIVMASIVLQLLVGSGIINKNLQTTEGKSWFQGTQKILTYGFILLEAIIYVALGGLTPEAGISPIVLIIQICIGGLLIVFMDDIINKWGFGSGVSLFIAAGVSKQIFIQAFSPLKNGEAFVGAIPHLFQALSTGSIVDVKITLLALIATLGVFALVVFAQAMKVEIPLSFGRIRGHGIRWPLNFVYTNVIPIILVSALVSNLQLFAELLNSKVLANIVPFLTNNNLFTHIASGSTTPIMFVQAGTYLLFYMGLAALFSWFWMQTSGLDPKSQARQMMSSGLQIPGFRKDGRVLERLLKRYIYPLTIMGGLFIGFLAAIADMTGAFGSGTGLLLTVMIIYKLYEEIGKQHMEDMNPALRKMMAK
ncbi:MAG: preprotein translocase subunit SecY [Candidatus Nanoarchaeia archaeon]